MRVTVKKILAAIDNENLDLVKGDDYWYFVYDDKADKYDTNSVYVVRLSDLTLENWVAEGVGLVQFMEMSADDLAQYMDNKFLTE